LAISAKSAIQDFARVLVLGVGIGVLLLVGRRSAGFVWLIDWPDRRRQSGCRSGRSVLLDDLFSWGCALFADGAVGCPDWLPVSPRQITSMFWMCVADAAFEARNITPILRRHACCPLAIALRDRF